MAHVSDASPFALIRDDATTPHRSKARPAAEIAAPLVPIILAKFAVLHDEFGDRASASSIRA
jgi:hypothetical protein